MTGIQTNQQFTQQNNQIFMYFQHNILFPSHFLEFKLHGIAPLGIPQTSLGFQGHLITNFPHIMVLLIIKLGV